METQFWTLNLGNVLTMLSVLFAFFGLVAGGRAKHDENTRTLSEISTKVEVLYDWFKAHTGPMK